MKVPIHEFDKTVTFYRDILGFQEIDASSPGDIDSVVFKFGDKNVGIIWLNEPVPFG